MISIIFGPAKSGKTEHLINLLREKVSLKEEVALFVPEQFSFETERKLIEKVGENGISSTPILSFSRLADEVKRLYGGGAARIMDESKRRLFMLKAIKSLKGELVAFKTDSKNCVDIFLSAMEEFKQAGVSSHQLFEVSRCVGNINLSQKLRDIALVISSYEALIKSTYIDPIYDIDLAYKKIKENGFFKDKIIVFDSFSTFTGQQFLIVKQAIIDAKEVYFSLCSDGNLDDEFGVFANVNLTAKKILSIAKDNNVEINKPLILSDFYYNNDELKVINEFFVGEERASSACDSVKAYSLLSKYDECEFAAKYIHRMVRLSNYRYRDFTFVCRSKGDYSSFVKSIFKKYNVPIYLNEKRILSESLLATFILSVLKASRSYKTEEIFRFLKTGLTDISQEDIIKLDNYVYLWNIKGDGWKEEWEYNPFGLTELNENKSQKAKTELRNLNIIRKKIISALNQLHYLKNAEGVEFCKNIYLILDEFQVSSHLGLKVEELKSKSMFENAEFQLAAWENTMSILDNIVEVFGEEKLSFSDFSNILQQSFSCMEIGGIPQGLDEVIFTTPEKLSTIDLKVTIVAGLNYGIFPRNDSDNGVFSPFERSQLREGFNIEISDKYISDTIEENFVAYHCFTAPTDELILLSHLSDYNSGKCETSPLLLSLCKFLGISVIHILTSEANFDDIESCEQAFSLAALKYSNDGFSETIFSQLADYELYNSKIEAIRRTVNNHKPSITPENALKIFGAQLKTSPSKIEKYFQCPYAFFCQYGLNVKKREQIDFKVMQRGTIAHYVFEQVLKNHYKENLINNKEKMIELIDGYIKTYVTANAVSYNKLDNKSKYIISRIKDMLIELIEYVLIELQNTEFEPIEFELCINNDGKVPPLQIETKKGKVILGGVVDRVDEAIIGGRPYVRIVDYKTGKKEFSLSDVLSGINLQMLIYLCALCENPQNKVYPAAVLYQPLNHIKRIGTKASIDANSSPKVKGITSEDADVREALDPDAKFMPFSIKTDGSLTKSSSCISEDDFYTVFKYLKDKVALMHENLLEGRIDIEPCFNDNSHKTCDYCDYKEICRYKYEKKSPLILSIPETIEVMKGGEE